MLVSDTNATFVVAQVIHASVNVIVDHSTRLEEGLLHVEVGLRRCLEEDQTVLFCKAFAFFSADLSSTVQICLVANEHNHDVRVSILPDFLEPPGQVIKRFFPCDVVHQESACCSTVVGPGDALEALLPRRVPDLQFDILFIDLHRATSELHSNGQVVLLAEALVCELQKKAGLADS